MNPFKSYQKFKKENEILMSILGWIAVIIAIIILFTYNSYPQTYRKLPESKITALQRVKLAESQIGITEEKDLVQVLKYLKTVRINYLAPWCMAFQYWVMDSVCKDLEIKNPLPRSGRANAPYEYAMNKYPLKYQYSPQIGDLLIWKNVGKSTGHVAMIVLITSNGNVQTIEGNTSSLSVRTGGMVQRKVRNLKHPIGKLKVRGIVGFSHE